MTEDAIPLDAAVWANMLMHPVWSALIIGTLIGIPFGAFIGVLLPAVGAPVPVLPELPAWARIALGAPAGWFVVWFQLSKPY